MKETFIFTYDIFSRMFNSERCLLYFHLIIQFGVLCLSFIDRYIGYLTINIAVEGTMMLDFYRNKGISYDTAQDKRIVLNEKHVYC